MSQTAIAPGPDRTGALEQRRAGEVYSGVDAGWRWLAVNPDHAEMREKLVTALNGLVLVVRHHHDDIGTIPENAIRIARLINGAGEIAGCLCEAPDTDDIREICCEAMRTAGIDISALTAILQAVEPEIEELAGLLRLDIVPSKVYALIAESVSEQISSALP